MNKPNSQSAQSATAPRADLLSYEDIYHAAGILNPPSGYGIQKVVDMLNSERLRDMAKDVKRSSVLMALDAAGTSLDDLLRDATRRQQALDSYESSRRKQLEEFEAHKSQENAQIEAELDRLRGHYAERIQRIWSRWIGKNSLSETGREPCNMKPSGSRKCLSFAGIRSQPHLIPPRVIVYRPARSTNRQPKQLPGKQLMPKSTTR